MIATEEDPFVTQAPPAAAPRCIELTLPYPVSANRYWRPVNIPNKFAKAGDKERPSHRQIFVPSKEAEAYKEQVGWMARAAGVRAPIPGRIAIEYTLHPHLPQDWRTRARKDPNGWEDTVQCMDLDNANKVLLDALKGIVFEDDKWVRQIVARRGEPRAEACLVVRVSAMKVEPVQLALEPA